MPSFTDTEGRTWTVRVTANTLKRVRDLAGVDLGKPFDDELIDRIALDPVLLADVLYAV